MAYATQQQIQIGAGGLAKLVELTDQDNNAAVDVTVLGEVQSQADGWIDGFLSKRYATPVDTTALTPSGKAKLVRWSVDETVFRLRTARHLVDEHDTKLHTDLEAELKEYRDGKRNLDEPLPNKSSAVISQFVENCGDVSRENLKGIF